MVWVEMSGQNGACVDENTLKETWRKKIRRGVECFALSTIWTNQIEILDKYVLCFEQIQLERDLERGNQTWR